MKPVAIFRHAASEGPGYLTDFLQRREIPWQLFRIDAGDTLPEDVTDYSGLVFMGGPMSVNDPLAWIPPVLNLIRLAVAQDVPVLGHCLGGQLMARALGGAVSANPVKEIGWGELQVSANAEASHWFGDITVFTGFHWHGETFSIPPGASAILASQHCSHQAFAYGKHLAFQCHIEMTAAMVRDWCRLGQAEVLQAADSPGVQNTREIERDLDARVALLNKVADEVYARWVLGLNQGPG